MFQEFQQNWKKAWEFNKQSWRLVRNTVNFRYWLLWLINIIVAQQLMFWLARVVELRVILVLVVVVMYFAISPLALLLWLPQYTKQKKPNYYRGIVRSIGEWIGNPYYLTKSRNK